MEQDRNLIVIGASAGGIGAISKVVAGLPETLDASVLVVVHLSAHSNAKNIAAIFQRNTQLKCMAATDGAEIRNGCLYVAPPEHHLMVKGPNLRLAQGPHENKYGPSIDVLFRSAAVHYGSRVTGVILTGMLDDGTSGMSAIKRCGGRCIVQDPANAEFSDMPRSVLNTVRADYKGSTDTIPELILGILSGPPQPAMPVPEELRIEAEITERMMSDINELKTIADQSDFVCPDCGGGLWEVRNDPMHRHRCHTGHVYTERLLNELRDKQIEESIWVSIRMLEEKYNMLLLMEKRGDRAGLEPKSTLTKRIEDTREHRPPEIIAGAYRQYAL